MLLVDSIIKLPQVQASSNVFFIVNKPLNTQSHMQHSLQIDGISNWLHQQIDGAPSKHYRILKILADDEFSLLVRLDSVQQLIDTMKAVSPV